MNTVYVKEEVYADLKMLSERDYRPMSAIIGIALNLYKQASSATSVAPAQTQATVSTPVEAPQAQSGENAPVKMPKVPEGLIPGSAAYADWLDTLPDEQFHLMHLESDIEKLEKHVGHYDMNGYKKYLKEQLENTKKRKLPPVVVENMMEENKRLINEYKSEHEGDLKRLAEMKAKLAACKQ